ncbi:MAG: ParB/RepB/Spo0J family partition protein [Planctomycetota bacterium]|nr:ParB/RepB/Spo0J family partition protein [Planctomycetota bacterium]
MDASRVVQVPLSEIKPSPENDKLYRPVNPDDPAILELAESIREHGLLEPLSLTRDNYITSGHRRYAAATVAGLETVPVRYESICRGDDPDAYVRLLREHNRQREKTLPEKLREELVSTDPDDAYQSLLNQREEAARVETVAFTIEGELKRRKISKAKMDLLQAAQRVIAERRTYWPLSVRQIHYALLNDPPLKHASKPGSRYDNSAKSYRAVVELLTRARLEGLVPWEAIADETRPVSNWLVFPSPQQFVSKENRKFLTGYSRDLQQSQPNHIEIVGEKNTVGSILRPVAGEFCIPMTIGRGFCSLDPRKEMALRYQKSGREKLIVLICSDHDPDGEEIAQSFARSMRDDFGIDQIHPVKVALTREQAQELNLPNALPAKKGSANYKKFLKQYGNHGWELESLPPATLQEFLREAIRSVMDLDAYNAEVDQERKDAAWLQGVRRTITGALSELTLDDDQDDDDQDDDA